MSGGDLELAESCLWKALDLSGLLLLYSSTGDAAGVARVAEAAQGKGKHNVGFLALMLLRRPEARRAPPRAHTCGPRARAHTCNRDG